MLRRCNRLLDGFAEKLGDPGLPRDVELFIGSVSAEITAIQGAARTNISFVCDGFGCPLPPKTGTPCVLQAPSGKYTLGPNAVAVFQPQMVNSLNTAFQNLNNQGIVPMITSGFRTAADQLRMQNGGSGANPAAAVSWHQVGLAIDLNHNVPNFQAIINAMTGQGLTWGGTFRRKPDPVHFQLPPAGTTPPAAMVQACQAGS